MVGKGPFLATAAMKAILFFNVSTDFTESKSFTARFNITLMESNVSLLAKAVIGAQKEEKLSFFPPHPLKVISLVRI